MSVIEEQSGPSKLSQWFSEVFADLKATPRGQAFRVWPMVLTPLLAVAALTALVRLTNFDLSAQQAIYLAGGNNWSMGEHPFWMFLYQTGGILALCVFSASVIGYVLSWKRPEWRGWRKLFLFNMLLLVVAPGIITNGILKEYWGRPRPREIEGMGGHFAFEPVLKIDSSSTGKSFPCGHATMGFYLMGGFFLMRRHRRELANASLVGGFVFGSLIGIARMARGGHFFSDVVWAFAICYFVALGLYYLLGLHRGLWSVPQRKSKRMPLWVQVAIGALSIGVFVSALLATPYKGIRNLYLISDVPKELPITFDFAFTVGEHQIVPGEEFKLVGEAYGHGVPTSRIAEYYSESKNEVGARVTYHERISGWFSEVNEFLEISLPWYRIAQLHLHVGEAELDLTLGPNSQSTILVADGSGPIVIRLGGQSLALKGGREEIISGKELLIQPTENSGVNLLEVGPDYSGTISILE